MFETTQPYEVPAKVIAKWYDVPRKNNEQDVAWTARKTARYAELAEPMKLWLAITRDGSYGRAPGDPSPADDGKPEDGIRFRVPASGRLLVCEKAACTRSPTDAVVAELAGPIAQLGHIYYASFKSAPFSNGTFQLVMDDQGRLKTLGATRKNASAETIANLGKDVAGEFGTIYSALHKTQAESTSEQLATLEAQKKLADARAAVDPNSSANQLAALEAQKKLSDARAALEQAPTYELARLTAIAEAQKKYNDAIAALQPDPSGDMEAQEAALGSESALLKAEAARIDAQIILRDAKERLGIP